MSDRKKISCSDGYKSTMDCCSVYLTPQSLPKYIYLSPPFIFTTTYNGIRTKNRPVWITSGAAPIRWMGPIRNPRWEQKRTEGYVIVSISNHHVLARNKERISFSLFLLVLIISISIIGVAWVFFLVRQLILGGPFFFKKMGAWNAFSRV